MKANADHDRNDKDYLNNEELAAQCARALRNLSLNRKYTSVSAFFKFFTREVTSSANFLTVLFNGMLPA